MNKKIIDIMCVFCGKVNGISVHRGKDKKIYIEYQNVWIRSRDLKSMCTFCDECIQKMEVLIKGE